MSINSVNVLDIDALLIASAIIKKIKAKSREVLMAVTWEKDFKPELIAREIEKIKRIQPDGNISFEGFIFTQYEIIIHSMLHYPDNFPEIEAKKVTWDAIRNAGKKGEITEKAIRSEVNKLVNTYLLSPLTKYVLATSISIQNELAKLPTREIKLEGSKIVFKNKLSTKYQMEASEIHKLAKTNIVGKYPQDYLPVLVHVSAKSIHEAADNALKAIDLARGIWNLYINQRTPWRISWGWGATKKPINRIILGPIHTLHFPKGNIAAPDIWWYEPQYLDPIETFKFDDAIKTNQFFHKTKTRLDTHPYGNVIKIAIIRYTRALDERISNNAFIRLWSVLELLTDTGKNSYDTTIRRASFIFEDKESAAQILEILRKYRNSFVHSDNESQDLETYLFQLKYYVEHMIRFHLWNKFGFISINEANQFLDSPTSEKTLNERIQAYKRAKKFLHYK